MEVEKLSLSGPACRFSPQKNKRRKRVRRWGNGCDHANAAVCEMFKNVNIHTEEISKAADLFRRLSSEVSGTAYTIPDGHLILFATCLRFSSQPVGVIVFKIAGKDDLHNEISFQFVLQMCQGHGIGKQLLREALEAMVLANRKKVKLDACKRSVGFYRKHGFRQIGSPVETVSHGSPMFSNLFHMEHAPMQC